MVGIHNHMERTTGFEAWFTASRADAATLLTDLGEGLEDGHVDWEAISIDVPETLDVEVECEPDGGRYEFEISMEWDVETGTVAESAAPETGDGEPDDREESGEDARETADDESKGGFPETDDGREETTRATAEGERGSVEGESGDRAAHEEDAGVDRSGTRDEREEREESATSASEDDGTETVSVRSEETTTRE